MSQPGLDSGILDELPAEHVAENGAERLRFGRVQEHVRTDDLKKIKNTKKKKKIKK